MTFEKFYGEVDRRAALAQILKSQIYSQFIW